MPAKIGYVGDQSHDRLVRDIVELSQFHQTQLVDRWVKMVAYWKLYLSHRDEFRSEAEKKWRANLVIPRPFANVETKVAVLANIVLSVDPTIQVEGVGDEDEEFARRIERLLDFTLRNEGFRRELPPILREVSICGTGFIKTTWDSRSHVVNVPFDPQSVKDYAQILLDATVAGAIPPPTTDLHSPEFELWRKTMNDALGSKGVNIPEPPKPGFKQHVDYLGPVLSRISPYDVFMDPLVPNWHEQPQVVHRVYKSKKWLDDRVKDGTYSEEAVAKAMSNSEGQLRSDHDRDINDVLGIPDDNNDPAMRDSVELWDVFRPEEEFPHLVILNQSGVINKSPEKMPYQHGDIPLVPLRNLIVPGHALGLSDMQPNEWLFYELTTLRNLRMDAAKLAILPILTRVRGAGGLPDLKKYLAPGKILDVQNPDAIQQLVKLQIPDAAWREPAECKQEIDESFGVGENVRGEAATVGRVSATETQSRLNQALSRLKLHAFAFEADWEPHLRHAISLWQEFGDKEVREQVAGVDPLLKFSAGDLERALGVDLRFRGATQAIAKDLVAQQLMMIFDKFGAVMIPAEQRALLKTIYQTLSLRNVDKVVSDQGTKDLTEAYELQKQMAQAQAAAAQMQSTMGQVGGPPPSKGAPPGMGLPPGGGNGAAPAGGEDEMTGEGPPA